MTDLANAINELNREQLTAFEVPGHCVVVAPPGSGKTRLLVTKMASDLLAVTPPRGIACITLTNAAAMEVHDRFDRLSTDRRSNLFIGTVHAFALTRIVRPFAAALGYPNLATARVLTQKETKAYWDFAIEDAAIASSDQPLLWETVKRSRNAMISEADWARLGAAPIAARDAYYARLEAANVLDFGRIVELAALFVNENKLVRRALRATFERIYVDEYQDLAPALDQIVRALCLEIDEHSSTLFAVGDVDQAIYGWTGTNSKLLRELAMQPGITSVPLKVNYRNGARILELSRRLFDSPGENRATANRAGGTVVCTKVSGSISGQATHVAQSVAKLQHENVPLDEIAVLCRTNAMAEQVAGILVDSGIPAWVKIADEWESPLTIAIERLAAWTGHGRESSGFQITPLVAEIQRMLPGASETMTGKLTVLALRTDPSGTALAFVEAVLEVLSEGRSDEQTEQTNEEVSKFLLELRSGSLLGLSVSELGDRRLSGGRVYVTTLSSSKGLEFDHVFILDLEDGRIPFYTSFGVPAELEEERNKFYVALTRARQSVTLLWSGFTIDRYQRRRPNALSRFVQELGTLD